MTSCVVNVGRGGHENGQGCASLVFFPGADDNYLEILRWRPDQRIIISTLFGGHSFYSKTSPPFHLITDHSPSKRCQEPLLLSPGLSLGSSGLPKLSQPTFQCLCSFVFSSLRRIGLNVLSSQTVQCRGEGPLKWGGSPLLGLDKCS